MSFLKWIGFDSRLEEALGKSKGYDLSPSNDDMNLHAPLTWEETAYGAFSNSRNKTKLTLDESWSQEKYPSNQDDADQIWSVKRKIS